MRSEKLDLDSAGLNVLVPPTLTSCWPRSRGQRKTSGRRRPLRPAPHRDQTARRPAPWSLCWSLSLYHRFFCCFFQIDTRVAIVFLLFSLSRPRDTGAGCALTVRTRLASLREVWPGTSPEKGGYRTRAQSLTLKKC